MEAKKRRNKCRQRSDKGLLGLRMEAYWRGQRSPKSGCEPYRWATRNLLLNGDGIAEKKLVFKEKSKNKESAIGPEIRKYRDKFFPQFPISIRLDK